MSTKEQAGSKLSLENQAERIRAFAKAHEFDLIKIYNDEAESAKDLNRQAAQELLGEVRRKCVTHVIIYKLDRLTRSVRDLGDLLDLFDKYGVALMSVTDSLDTASASGRLVVNLMASVAQWEREVIAERTQVALDVKRARGEKLGGITPFGYQVLEGMLVPNPKEYVVLKVILDAKNAGYGYQVIADRLNKIGTRPRKGRRWYSSTIRSICLRAAKATKA